MNAATLQVKDNAIASKLYMAMELSHKRRPGLSEHCLCWTHMPLWTKQGITGPLEVFEGNKGFMDSIAGPFFIDWSQEDLERVARTIIKKYNTDRSVSSGLMCRAC